MGKEGFAIWHLVSRGLRCCYVSYNTQDRPLPDQKKIIKPQMSTVVRLGTAVEDGYKIFEVEKYFEAFRSDEENRFMLSLERRIRLARCSVSSWFIKFMRERI